MHGKACWLIAYKLEHIDLSSNQIRTIDYEVYGGLKAIQSIDLRFNGILFIDNSKVFSILSLVGVDVYMDVPVYCCSLDPALHCFVSDRTVMHAMEMCRVQKITAISYFNIIFSLFILIVDIAMVFLNKATNKKSSHYAIFKQFFLATLLQTLYMIIINLVLVFVRNEGIYLQTLWPKSFGCYFLSVVFSTGFLLSKLLSFILVLDQFVAVKYVLLKYKWSDHILWVLLSCWVISILAAILQQYFAPSNTPSCLPFVLPTFDPTLVFVTSTLFFITACLTSAIPYIYYKIASHVKASNKNVRNKNAAANQKAIIRKGAVVTGVSVGTWLLILSVTLISCAQSAQKQADDILIDTAIHASECLLVAYYLYTINLPQLNQLTKLYSRRIPNFLRL